MSGSAYAINGPLAGTNTVGSADIINKEVKAPDLASGATTGAVTSAKVRKDALTGADVLESSLGQVPSANTANSAATATSATNATNAGNADKLDNIDSTGFIKDGATAGGDLTGTYPNPTIGNDAVNSANVSNKTLTVNDLQGINLLSLDRLLCNDATPSNGSADLCGGSFNVGDPYVVTFSCQDEGGGGVTAKIVLDDTDSGSSFAADSNGPNATTDSVGSSAVNATLVLAGPTTAAHYQGGSYSAFAQASNTSISGDASVGTNIFGKDCAFNLSVFGV